MSMYSRKSISVACSAIAMVASGLMYAQTAPTAKVLTPEEINEQWVKATSSVAPQREAYLKHMNQTIAQGPFHADWPSLKHYKTPTWFNDAKFGIFIHWGAFSVPAFGNEWYPRDMYQKDMKEYAHHRTTYGTQDKTGYKDLIPKFRMEKFDPDAWADLFAESGARYVIPVAEHHDGFAEYKTELTRWNAVAMGPHRDILGDLETSVRKHGLRFGVSSHRAEHDWFYDGGREIDSDVNDPKYADLYGPAQHRDNPPDGDPGFEKEYTYVSQEYLNDWLARSTELIDRYNPDLLYFDWWVGFGDFRPTQERFASYYYNHAAAKKQQVVLFSKYSNMAPDAATFDMERGALNAIHKDPWQTDTSISNASWGYVEGDTYKSPEIILQQLIDIVSKNGNLLLNIGPKADGTIPPQAVEILKQVGAWLKVNGEAIYGTRPWREFGEGPTSASTGSFSDRTKVPYTEKDFRFTTHGKTLYAIGMSKPAGPQIIVHSLKQGKDQVAKVSLVGNASNLSWKETSDGLQLTLPSSISQSSLPYVLKIDLN